MKGRIPSNLALINANKFGVCNPMFGKHLSQESLLKKSESLKKGWENNLTRKKEARERFSEDKNPRWKGGITPFTLQ